MSNLVLDAICPAPIMRASSGPRDQVEHKLPNQIGDERRQASGVQADIDLVAFIKINAAEVVDAAKKGLILRASLLERASKSKDFWRCEAGLKRPQITGCSPVETIFNN